MTDKFRVGVITASHGLKGEVKVFPTTDSPDRYDTLQEVLLFDGREYLPLTIDRHRYFKQMVIVHFEGLDRIEDIQAFIKKELYVDREHAEPLAEGEYYIADLIGCRVYDEAETYLGEVADVLQTGANDVYVVKGEDREILIPVIKDCVLAVDTEEGIIRVHLLKGLID